MPHCGTLIPNDIGDKIKPEFRLRNIDTDWHVDRLYSFAPSMGITLICAKYSRYVIDLNRDPSGKKLYSDSRQETQLVPTKSFIGKDLYISDLPDQNEISRRIKIYYEPYHQAIRDELALLKSNFKNVVFFDAHSIRSLVESIRSTKFPHLILGNLDGKTAHAEIIKTAEEVLKTNYMKFSFSSNDPFKGGFLTRDIGKPEKGIHSLQLEMCQSIYMNEDTLEFDTSKSGHVEGILQQLFTALIGKLKVMNK